LNIREDNRLDLKQQSLQLGLKHNYPFVIL
jgi:hypothetical protein